ncbi:hypothetical protein D3C85_1323280 [compost metagenome]
MFHTSRVPNPAIPASVGPLANWVEAFKRRGSMWKPNPPSVLTVHGASSVPSERPKVKVR